MPPGVPVATVSIDGGRNAGLLAMKILGSGDAAFQSKLLAFKQRLMMESRAKNKTLQKDL
jgi:5-(carboxyamino)imidazole ribonucleotide mutase